MIASSEGSTGSRQPGANLRHKSLVLSSHCSFKTFNDRLPASGRSILGRREHVIRAGAHCGKPDLVHAMAVRANMRSILVAMMKSFSCNPLIFLVCTETVA